MTDDRVRTPRTLFISDHIWDAFSRMATEMGSERDGLINQALYTFARLNGFLSPGDLSAQPRGASATVQPPPHLAGMPANKRIAAAPLDARAVTITPAAAVPTPGAEASSPASRANPERVAELERQLNGASARGSNPPPVAPAGGKGSIEIDDSLLGDDMGQATNMDLPNLADLPPARSRANAPPVGLPAQGRGDLPVSREKVLVLLAEGRELDRVVKERFLIGRGKHCDLIINSGKVSREHAAITKEGADYFIEDLGSSNGTWYDKRRITRRQIEDGDEYYICAEKLSCVFR